MGTRYIVTAELGSVEATDPDEACMIVERALAGIMDSRLLRARKACVKCGRAIPPVRQQLADHEDERCERCADS